MRKGEEIQEEERVGWAPRVQLRPWAPGALFLQGHSGFRLEEEEGVLYGHPGPGPLDSG